MRPAAFRSLERAWDIAASVKRIFARPKPRNEIARPSASSIFIPGGSLRLRISIEHPRRSAISLKAMAVRRLASWTPPTPSNWGKRPIIRVTRGADSGDVAGDVWPVDFIFPARVSGKNRPCVAGSHRISRTVPWHFAPRCSAGRSQ